MTLVRWPLLGLMLTLIAPTMAAEPNPADDSGTISIMRPEPGTQPAKRPRARKHTPRQQETAVPKGYGVQEDTRRGSSNPVYPAPLPGPQAPLAVPHIESAPARPVTPPPLYVPETGRTLPNLPAVGGAETSQDRAARCAHQAGVYGPNATGNLNSYIGSCINQ
jgi:hypothetical protein